jgi:hypothetical protein
MLAGKAKAARHSRRAFRTEQSMKTPNASNIFEITCPDCGAQIKVDASTHSVIAHTSAPRKRTFEDFEAASRHLKEQEERKQAIFRQSVEAEKNKDDVMAKKFAEALRRAKETPDEPRPLRDFDLD